MTKKQKVKAINERLGKHIFDDGYAVSVLLIADILDQLAKRGLIQSPFETSSLGKDVIAICEEFGWEITDAEIQQFCEELVPDEQIDAFVFYIRAVRDKTLE